MFLIKSLCFFAFLQTVISDLSSMEPCLATDIDCLSKTTQTFLDNTSGGIPQFDIRTLDPITIPHLDVTPEGVGVTFHLKNIVVQGFKDQKISSFKLDKDSKAVSLKTKVNVTFNSDITVELHKLSKSYSGKLDAQAYAEGHAQYTYVFKTDDKGVEHYEVGPETNSCELLGDPKFTLSPDLVSALEADAEYQAEKAKHSGIVSKTREAIICEVVKTVYVTAIHNIRASARILPKSAFFKDV
ncbi:juvenile hormone-binding protein [Amyelois transitella]|uniref:juvenile hormone-binding protein n=1 Tax=Amyelois transitella TaxID=680683 RepID=UPI0029900014|nr:juvenile hormone-binding protein [Amyelois transitella]